MGKTSPAGKGLTQSHSSLHHALQLSVDAFGSLNLNLPICEVSMTLKCTLHRSVVKIKWYNAYKSTWKCLAG
jgi:hypothetical protein